MTRANRASRLLCIIPFVAGAASAVHAEDIRLSCKIRLPNSDRTFISQFDINEQRVIGDGANITKDVRLGETEIAFRVDNYLLGFVSEAKIDRASGAYTEIRSKRKSSDVLNEWRGECTKLEKPASGKF